MGDFEKKFPISACRKKKIALQSNTVFSFIVLLQELNKIKILTCLNTERKDLRIVVYRPMQSTCVRISLETRMK